MAIRPAQGMSLKQAIGVAQRFNLNYVPFPQLLQNPDDILKHISVPDSSKKKNQEKVVLSGVPGLASDGGNLILSKLFDQYLRIAQSQLINLSKQQLRKWRVPRLRAITSLIKVVGDHCRVNLDNIFSGLLFSNNQKRQRLPFSAEYIEEILLDGEHLSGLNGEARTIMRTMINTDARISEICGLEPQDINLEASIPHIIIRPNQLRQLKSASSRHDLPLVKSSLVAMQEWADGFKRYRGKNDGASGAINKYLRENELLPGAGYSLYSLRHSFQQHLIEVEAPERIQAELMGHVLSRPRYGKGPDLAQKSRWIEKLRFNPRPFAPAPCQFCCGGDQVWRFACRLICAPCRKRSQLP